tara:strand:- start:651 stop:3131 length:2481 start_codon:yes stop_codon:yes gene_type:complete
MNNTKKKITRKFKVNGAEKKPLDIIQFCSSNGLLRIHTRFFYKNGKKTPCYISRIKISNNDFVYSPNFGVPFYKWDSKMVSAHNRWLAEHGKLSECDGVIILLYNTQFIMVDTDDKDAEDFVIGLNEFNGAPITKSLTKKYGRHRYIKIDKSGNYQAELKVNNMELDIITEYAFESVNSKVENLACVCEMTIEKFNSVLNIQLREKDLNALESSIHTHNNKKDKKFKIKDKIRNNFLNEDETIPREILIRMIEALNPECFGSYTHWFRLLCGIHNQALNQEEDIEYMGLFIEFMNKHPSATADWYRENVKTWKDITDNQLDTDKMVKSGSLWKYLKEQNEDVFIQLKRLRRQQIDPPSFNKISSYKKQKELFEKDCFIVKSEKPTYCEMDWVEAQLKERSMDAFKQNFINLNSVIETTDPKGKKKMIIKNFCDLWITDQNRREYDRMNFVPPPRECNRYTYNLYDGLFIDDVEDEQFEEMNEEERIEKIERVLAHLYYLSGCDKKSYDYLLKLFAYKLQYPAYLPKVQIVFRSVQGCGKNAFLDWFGNKILGNKYYACSSNAEDFVGQFNSAVKGKLLVVFNEMDGNAGYKYSARLKEFGTEEEIFHEKKGIDRKKIKNCMLTCFATNKKNPVCIEVGDRRFFVVECSDKVLYIENYFEDLFEDLEDPLVAKCFAWYLRDIIEIEEDYNFKRHRPITRIYKELQFRNKSVIVKFAEWFVSGKCLETKYDMTKLWDLFCEFMDEWRLKNKLDRPAFENCLNEYVYTGSEENLSSRDIKKIIRKKKISRYVYQFNIPRTKNLIESFDLDKDIDFSDCSESESEEEFLD